MRVEGRGGGEEGEGMGDESGREGLERGEGGVIVIYHIPVPRSDDDMAFLSLLLLSLYCTP